MLLPTIEFVRGQWLEEGWPDFELATKDAKLPFLWRRFDGYQARHWAFAA